MAIDATSIVTNSQTYIAAMQSQAAAAVSTLNSYASSWTHTTFSPVIKSSAPSVGTMPTLTTGSIGNLPSFAPADMTLIASPTLATAPVLTAYTAPVWNEAYWTNLKTLLTTFTSDITGADDLDSVIIKLTSETDRLQVAMFQNELERKQQVLRDQTSAANANTGAKGFSYPTMMTTALLLNAQQKFSFDLSQVSRDLIKMISEWAKTNYQFSVQQQMSAHEQDVLFNAKYADALLQSFATTLNGTLAKYKADVEHIAAKVEMQVKAYLAQAEANNKNYISQADTQIKTFLAENEVGNKNFELDIQNKAAMAGLDMKAAAENANNKIQASAAVMQGAAAISSSAGNLAVAVFNG